MLFFLIGHFMRPFKWKSITNIVGCSALMYKVPLVDKKETSMTSTMARITLFSFLFLLFIPYFTSAETKTFIKEYTYQASDVDSKYSCRTIALEHVKRLLLQELGTYLESETEVRNFQLSKDQITILTAGIVQTEIVAEKWDGDSLKYWLKVRIIADPHDVIKSIDSLRKDRTKSKEIEDANKKADAALKKIEILRKELEVAKKDQKKIAQYNQEVWKLNASDLLFKGISLSNKGKYGEAINAFTKAIELNPDYVAAYCLRGITYSKSRKFQQAIEDLNKAIKLDPNEFRAYLSRGIIYNDLDKHQQAIKDFTKCIELVDPGDPLASSAYGLRGGTYDALGFYQEAIKDCTRAIDLNPSDAWNYYGRGRAYGHLGNYQQSISDLNKSIELNPDRDLAYGDRAHIYFKIGKMDDAIRDIKMAARLGNKGAQNYLKRFGIE